MLLESNPLIIYHFMKFKKNLIFTLYSGTYMVKYFLKILFTLVFLKLLSRVALGSVLLLTPTYGEVLDEPVVHFTWQVIDSQEEYIFRHYHYTSGFVNGSAITRIVEGRETTRGTVDNKIYFWKVQYHPKATFEGEFDFESDISVYSINREIPEEILEMYLVEEEEEILEDDEDGEEQEEEKILEDDEDGEEETEEEMDEEKSEETVEDEGVEENRPLELPFLPEDNEDLEETERIVQEEERGSELSPSQNRYVTRLRQEDILTENIAVQEKEFNWNVSTGRSVLGVSERTEIVCRFKYVRGKGELEKMYCNTPRIRIEEEIKYLIGNDYLVFLSGEVITNYNVLVHEYACDFNFLKPTTWFGCEEKFVKNTTLPLQPHMLFNMYKDNKRVAVRSFTLDGREFRLLAGYVKDVSDMRLVHKYRMVSNKFNIVLDLEREYSINPRNIDVEFGIEDSEEKPFSFPFNRIIGVTQWYGYTAYQSPHAGIDFGARKESVLAVGDGEVVSKGWDGYEGKCLSGGNYLIIKHSNGMHTTYFHLEDMYVNTGDFVKKGQVIAKSGNTGAWNCQRLGYHLHFETRLNASSSSHSNPVKYIDVDWNKVPTLGYKTYPGRLTGENPHPGR